MAALDLPIWLAAALAAIALLLVVGVLHALAIRVQNDREVHDLRVRATRLRLEQLKRIARQMQDRADAAEAPEAWPEADAAPDEAPAMRQAA